MVNSNVNIFGEKKVPLEPQSRFRDKLLEFDWFGDKLLRFGWFVPKNGTAALKGLKAQKKKTFRSVSPLLRVLAHFSIKIKT